MNLNNEIMELTEKIINSSFINVDDIPKIDLYMEQVLSFLEQEMDGSLRSKEEPVFTKTMVNNYTKEGILPRPQKKKYNKTHIIMLAYIFMLKQILSIQDIKTFFTLLEDKEQLEPLYRITCEMADDYRREYSDFVAQRIEKIDETFERHGIDDENMKLMAFISMMAHEAMANKMICGQLLKPDEKQEGEAAEAVKAVKGKEA